MKFITFLSLIAISTAYSAVDIYVEFRAFASDGYNFYTDSSKTTELNFFEGTDKLFVNETYRFFRLSDGAHRFYVSDDQLNAANLTNGSGPSADISLSGDGSYTYNAGIGANEEFTLSFNSGFDVNTDKLYYYCTAHPTGMVAEFSVAVPEPSTYALLFGAVALAVAIRRRR